MLPVRYGSRLLLFGGGRQGPNGSYDAWYEDQIENIFAGAAPLGDGDGWDDAIAFHPNWLLNAGVAVIFAGGPYIPTDDPTVGVRQEAVAGESGGLYMWPNPVEGELNIVWGGTCRECPLASRSTTSWGGWSPEGASSRASALRVGSVRRYRGGRIC